MNNKTMIGIMVGFADGHMLAYAPDPDGDDIGIRLSANLSFHEGSVDLYGVPPHKHSAVVADLKHGDVLAMIASTRVDHGPPRSMVSTLVRTLDDRTRALLYSVDGLGYLVIALWSDLTHDEQRAVLKARKFKLDAAEPGEVLEPLEVPDHKHWLASDRPMPLSAALWIFETLTADAVTVACNCAEPTRREIDAEYADDGDDYAGVGPGVGPIESPVDRVVELLQSIDAKLKSSLP